MYIRDLLIPRNWLSAADRRLRHWLLRLSEPKTLSRLMVCFFAGALLAIALLLLVLALGWLYTHFFHG